MMEEIEKTELEVAMQMINTPKTTIDVVDQSEQEMLEKIKQQTNFQDRSEDLITKAVNAELEKREIIVLSQEQQNTLAKLQLKLNKKSMRAEAKAEHYDRKRKSKMIRYGYLYTPYEVEIIDPNTGELKKETRYKNFTTNSFINHYKEFANFYTNLTDTTKHIISKTLKFLFWLSLIAAVIGIFYGIIHWLIQSGFFAKLSEKATEIVESEQRKRMTEIVIENIKILMLNFRR